jgi:hypothetical protein
VKLCLASTHFLATLLKKEFNGEDGRTTVNQYLAQIEEASLVDVLKVDLFSLSLTSTAFSCVFSLFSNSIYSWKQLEHIFHVNFYSVDNELKLSDLTHQLRKVSRFMIIFGDLEKQKLMFRFDNC